MEENESKKPNINRVSNEYEEKRTESWQEYSEIRKFELLKRNYLKLLFFGTLMTCSIIGLLILKYYKQVRAIMFYSHLAKYQAQQATHAYVEGNNQNIQICEFRSIQFKGRERMVFIFDNLRYQWIQDNSFPVKFSYQQISQKINHQFLSKISSFQRLAEQGLNQNQVLQYSQFYGKNEHKVIVPSYLSYLFDVMTQAFFIMQYITSIIYIFENLAAFAGLMIFFGVITTTINYLLLYWSFNNIKKTAENVFDIKVIRNGIQVDIHNINLLPQDIYYAQREIPCDSIILKGDFVVDESSQTGQSAPVSKIELQNDEFKEQKHWVYEGSKIVQNKRGDRILLMAINTGFSSRRGQIIRKIIARIPRKYQFFNKLIYFLVQTMLVSFIVYGATVSMMLKLDIEAIMIGFRLLDFITYSFPVSLPIFFNLAYSFCLWRLSQNQISGIQSQKTIQSARLKTLYFDKTGTLTQVKLKVQNVYTNRNNLFEDSTSELSTAQDENKDHKLVMNILACCHQVQWVSQKYEGNQVDLAIFQFSKAKILDNSKNRKKNARFISILGERIQILKINQYKSRFQQMSVMYTFRNKYYIAAKGNPQKLYSKKINQQVENFDEFIEQKSLKGCRIIGFGCYQINEKEVDYFLKSTHREEFLAVNFLGLITFASQELQDIKKSVQIAIKAFNENGINTKMITGDNLILGAKTAITTGMIPKNVTVVVVKGEQYKGEGMPLKFRELKYVDGQIRLTKKQTNNFSFLQDKFITYAVDNEFIQNNLFAKFWREQIRIFGRITPENKALIIKKEKESIAEEINSRSLRRYIFSETSLKVGMVGDGANDLIAIKQADVGISIKDTKAVYSASFVVNNLSQISKIILEGKNTERQIVEMAQFFSIANYLSITSTIILTPDSSFNTSYQLIYKNFAIVLSSTFFFAFSRPAISPSKYRPNSNFMGIQNHLVFWLSCLMLSGGQIWGYLYYYNSNDFIPNPQPKVTFSNGWNGACKSATANFLITILEFTFLPFIIYRSSPWKQPFYKNILFTGLFIFNVAMIFPLFFSTQSFSSMDLQPIGRRETGIMMVIAGIFCLGCGVLNLIIEWAFSHKKINQNNQKETADQTLS